MAKIITVINQKGGVGKTTTAHAIGAWLQIKQNKKVLFLDLDQQSNLSYATGANSSGYSTLEVLVSGHLDISKVQTTISGYNVVPASPMLASIDSVLAATGKEYRLKEALEEVSYYDFIVIDTPPSLNIITVNALTASDYAVIPAQADIFSLQGITQLGQTIETIKKYTNPTLNVLGVILTRHNQRTILSRDLQNVIATTAKELHTKLYSQTIREAIAVKEAQAFKKDIFIYDPKSTATQDYDLLMNELFKDMQS